MDTTSLWHSISNTTESDVYSPLTHDIEVDVAVIGGGITGITTALQLIQAGKKVAVIEAHRIGEGTTGSSTGNLYVAVQPYYQSIASKFNLNVAKTIAHSRQFAIDYIEQIIHERNINCNFVRRPWYLYTNDDKEVSFLEQEVEIFKKMEINIEYTQSLPLSLKFKKASLMANQARFNPLRYVKGIAADLHKKNCLIFEMTRVTGMEEKDFCTLITEGGKVTANKVVIATHTPIGINLSQMYTAPYRSYVVAVKLEDNICPEGHLWEIAHPHHSICTHAFSSDYPELLLVAGSHHKTGQGKNMATHYSELETYLRKNFAVQAIEHKWSAQHYHSADDIPYIGLASRSARHTYLATGYFADGLIYGTLAGMIVADSILTKDNSLANVYRSNRFTPLASASFLARENANIFMQYLKDLPFKSKKDFRSIKSGQGEIVEIKGEKCAVSRDQHNNLHVVSAVCPHMKCIVKWNDAEKTWDCPCHGSRFSQEGMVLEGPAMHDLSKKDFNIS